jgi:hypothetical protein
MKYTGLYLFLIINLLLIGIALPVSACGFYESESDYQAMMFRVRLPEMDFYRPFEYTMRSQWADELNSDPYQSDRIRNCREWAETCMQKVQVDEIYVLLYQTDAGLFLSHVVNNQPNVVLQKNKFLQYLRQPANRELFSYLIFAKKAEIFQQSSDGRFEDWDSYYNYNDNTEFNTRNKFELYKLAKQKIKAAKSKFVQQRYAYQLCRLSYELNLKPDAATLYDYYFGKINTDNLMSVWSLIYKAHALKGDERSRALIQVFEGCNEKKFRCVQLMPATGTMPAKLTKEEKATFLQMQTLQDPGRSLTKIQQIYKLNPNNQGMYFLITREINKLEDWLSTPYIFKKYSISNDDPFRDAYFSSWEQFLLENPEYKINQDSIDQQEKENLAADVKYLSELKTFILEIRKKAAANYRDFYSIALAHLSLLQENAGEATNFLAEIPETTSPSILVQKKLEEVWLAIQTTDIHSSSFENLFVNNVGMLQKINPEVLDTKQMLYTLTQALANKYLQQNDLVKGNLMRMRADDYRTGYVWGVSYPEYLSGYESIHYFDLNARVQDIDQLLVLLQKKNKSEFEQYLSFNLEHSVDLFRDLKGTLAFRNMDLATAYEAFSALPKDYWSKPGSMFEYDLQKDPFKPKGLGKNITQPSDYQFNKAAFIKELMELEKKATSDKSRAAFFYNQLGNAWFNTSYWGNAWMMNRYSWSCTDTYYVKTQRLPAWMQNYMLALQARKYYLKAYITAQDQEQKAYATVMLHYITRLSYQYNSNSHDNQRALYYGNIFRKMKNTRTFRQYDCPGIEGFLGE